MDKPTSSLVPVTLGITNSYGDQEFIVEHVDGTRKYFYAIEGELTLVRRIAEEYRQRNLIQSKEFNCA